MANPKLRFYFREPTIDTNIPITDGTVKIEGFDWEFVPTEEECDAWDCGFAARVRAFCRRVCPYSVPCQGVLQGPVKSYAQTTSVVSRSLHPFFEKMSSL